MVSSPLRLLATVAAASALAWAAYEGRAMLLAGALLALLCGGLFLWMKAGRGRDDTLHDPAVSTLVFPPESKFQQSVLPPR